MKMEFALAGLIAAVAIAMASTGCNAASDDGSDDTPSATNTTSVIIMAQQDNSGSVWENGSVYTDVAAVGDTVGSNLGIRGFVSFGLSAVPESAEIVSARLDLNHYSVTAPEQDPFAASSSLSNFVVLAQNYGTLEAGDYSAGSYALVYDSISGGSALSSIDVTGALIAALENGYTRFQVRLQFATESNGDGVAQLARFDDSMVRLTVVYSIPTL